MAAKKVRLLDIDAKSVVKVSQSWAKRMLGINPKRYRILAENESVVEVKDLDSGSTFVLQKEEAFARQTLNPSRYVVLTEENINNRIAEGTLQDVTPAPQYIAVEDEVVEKEEIIPVELTEVNISTAALKLAKAQDVDVSQIKGTGTGGKITVNDVRAIL